MTKPANPDPLDGPYVDFIRAETRGRWEDLTAAYAARTGHTVPLLTDAVVREFADRNHVPPGSQWLTASLSYAAAYRRDLRPEEFQRLLALVSRDDLSLQLQPQPIEILDAIDSIRPAPAMAIKPPVTVPTIKPIRSPGRPKWERHIFIAHFAGAQREAESHGDDPTRLSLVAKYFKNLSDEPDVDVGWLRKLRARFLPEEAAE